MKKKLEELKKIGVTILVWMIYVICTIFNFEIHYNLKINERIELETWLIKYQQWVQQLGRRYFTWSWKV